MGRICMLMGREKAAVAWFVKALRLDPAMWGAYSQLCALGECENESYFTTHLLGRVLLCGLKGRGAQVESSRRESWGWVSWGIRERF